VPGHGFLGPVSAVSARDMWALETTHAAGTLIPSKATVLHWNGRVWRAVAHQPDVPAHGFLAAVLAEPGGAVWVGGSAPNSSHGSSALVQRWNGRTWTNLSPAASPSRRHVSITALARAGRGGVWGLSSTPALFAQLWHYSGGAWSVPVSPRWYPFWLAGVPGASSVWAVGASAKGYDAVIALAGPLPR
jgi:hypothetical protein